MRKVVKITSIAMSIALIGIGCIACSNSDNEKAAEETSQTTTQSQETTDSKNEEESQSQGDNAESNDNDGPMEGISNNIKYTADITSSWEQGKETFYQYVLTLENTSDKEIEEWSIDISFNEDIKFSNGWNGEYEAKGSTLNITSMDYNGTIPAGGKTTDVGFIVSGSEDLQLNISE